MDSTLIPPAEAMDELLLPPDVPAVPPYPDQSADLPPSEQPVPTGPLDILSEVPADQPVGEQSTQVSVSVYT